MTKCQQIVAIIMLVELTVFLVGAGIVMLKVIANIRAINRQIASSIERLNSHHPDHFSSQR